MNGLIRLSVGTAVLAVSVAAGAQALYQDESAPVDARVADLIGRLTTEEKVGLLRATSRRYLDLVLINIIMATRRSTVWCARTFYGFPTGRRAGGPHGIPI